MDNENKRAAIRVCAISDVECSRGCGAGACKKEIAQNEEMIRFCPDCGLLGEIPEGYQACCPDSSHARVVPKRFAELCAETFKLCVSQPFKSSAAQPDERAAFEAWALTDEGNCEAYDLDRKLGNVYDYANEDVQRDWVVWQARARATQQATKGDERAVAIREVAAYINKKADDYALEYGSDDMGALSFGTGRHAQDKHEYHSNLLELAEEIEALASAIPSPVAGSAGQAPVAKVSVSHHQNGGFEFEPTQYGIDTLRNGSYALYLAPTAPSLATDAGAVLTVGQRQSIGLAISEFERKGWADPAAMLRPLLAAHPTEQRMSDAARDAERYRYLRNHRDGIEFRDGDGVWRSDCPTGSSLDSIVDAARKAEIERSGGAQ